MAGITATYVNTTTFTVLGDQTSQFNTGRRVRATIDVGYLYGTVVSSSYSSPNTTVILSGITLNSNLSTVYYGIQADDIGSLPQHTHDSTEGEGGELISDVAFSDAWNGISTIAPSKNSVFDKIKTLSNFHDYTESPILISGGGLSEGTTPGTLKVEALTAILRDEDSEIGGLVYVTKDTEDNIVLDATNTTYVIVLNYNNGIPTITLEGGYPNLTQNINIGIVHNNTDINSFLVGEGGFRLHNLPQRVHRRGVELRASELARGSSIAHSGTDNFTMTEGIVYSGLNRGTWNAYDSAVDKFTTVYRTNGEGIYTLIPDQTAIDFAHFDDGAGTLGDIGVAKYGVHWVYRTFSGCVYVVYGYSGSYILEAAEAAEAPNIPDFLIAFGLLVGKIIAPYGGGNFTTIQMVTDTFFSGTAVTSHNDLGGLNDDDYKHLTDAEYGKVDNAATAISDGYATSTQIDKLDSITGSADITGDNPPQAHTHNDIYYTETETNTWRNSTTQTEMGHVHGVTSDIQTQLTAKLTNVSEDTTPELSGPLVVGEQDIKLDSLLSTDGKYSGITCDGVLGDTLAFGDLVYLNTTDQRWELADADAEATAGDVMLAIVLAAGGDGDTRLLLLRGFVREDDWNFTSYGQALFISTTAGDMSHTAPSATGDIVRVIGYAGTIADQIYFSPDNTWIELS